jgi:hypothetical protein
MSDFFYDGQIRRYLTQYMRVMSNFSYKDGMGKLHQIPVMYGDPNRQAAATLKKNSENAIPTAPFIACYIKSVEFDQERLQQPDFVSKVQIRERAFDEETGEYLTTQGQGYTVERIMPVPYKLTFAADIWTTNTEQKLQIFEQLAYLFAPSLELQTTDNYLDWTSLTILQLSNMSWSSRVIPQGVDQDIDIMNLTFFTPIWITPPAKVKRLGIITKIIANAFNDKTGIIVTDYNTPNSVHTGLGQPLFSTTVSPGNYELLVLDNVASLITNGANKDANDTSIPSGTTSWLKILDLYPGQFRAGLSTIRLQKPDGTSIVAYISLDAHNETRMLLTFDPDTIPTNTILNNGRTTVDAIINPETFDPRGAVAGTTYLILENINVVPEYNDFTYHGPEAWKNSDYTNFQAYANDIIQWNGNSWSVVFDSTVSQPTTYITNAYTGIQYVWNGNEWNKSFEGIYSPQLWSIIL